MATALAVKSGWIVLSDFKKIGEWSLTVPSLVAVRRDGEQCTSNQKKLQTRRQWWWRVCSFPAHFRRFQSAWSLGSSNRRSTRSPVMVVWPYEARRSETEWEKFRLTWSLLASALSLLLRIISLFSMNQDWVVFQDVDVKKNGCGSLREENKGGDNEERKMSNLGA